MSACGRGIAYDTVTTVDGHSVMNTVSAQSDGFNYNSSTFLNLCNI